MLILFSVGTLFVYQRALSYSEDAYDLSLMESANDIEQLVRTSLNNSGRIDMLRSMKEMQDILLTDQYDKTFFSLLDEQGHLIAGDGKLPLPPTDSKTTGEKKPRLYDTTIGEKPVRALLKKLTRPKLYPVSFRLLFQPNEDPVLSLKNTLYIDIRLYIEV